MWDINPEIVRINDKEEANKVRIFISSGMTSFLKMAYVGHYLFDKLQGAEGQTIFWTSRQRVHQYKEYCFKVREGVNVPLDLSAFDQKAVTREMVIILFTHICTLVTGEVQDVAKALLAQYLAGPIAELPTGEKLPVKKGMLSGWYWTAFMDSVISWCIGRMLTDEFDYMASQGDDILLKLRCKDAFYRLWARVKLYKIEVNEDKFYVSFGERARTEYLRTSFEPEGMFGYPARAIGSLLWRKPWLERPVNRRTRIESALSSWKRVQNRLGTNVLLEWILEDINGIWPGIDRRVLYIPRIPDRS